MSIPAESLPLIEDTLNRLAAESILAQVGRDEGLIPAYSLLGELLEQASTQPEVSEPARALRDYLEKRLDNAMPFDEPGLTGLLILRSRALQKLPDSAPCSSISTPTPATPSCR